MQAADLLKELFSGVVYLGTADGLKTLIMIPIPLATMLLYRFTIRASEARVYTSMG